MKSFRDLKVWEKAHLLALAAYDGTANFPTQEMFGLVSQIRRCASSIPANIAEGCGRRGNGEFHRFLQIAMARRVNSNSNTTCFFRVISNFFMRTCILL
jgi:23S rRNA-intervening sequence protein